MDLRAVEVVENDAYGDGCSSSIAAALEHVDERCDVLVLMLGDQPGVGAANVEALLDGRGDAPLAACAYRDGRGHPLAFARSMFGELAALHGDKGVWKLLDRHAAEVVDVAIDGPRPARRRHLGGLPARPARRRGGLARRALPITDTAEHTLGGQELCAPRCRDSSGSTALRLRLPSVRSVASGEIKSLRVASCSVLSSR